MSINDIDYIELVEHDTQSNQNMGNKNTTTHQNTKSIDMFLNDFEKNENEYKTLNNFTDISNSMLKQFNKNVQNISTELVSLNVLNSTFSTNNKVKVSSQSSVSIPIVTEIKKLSLEKEEMDPEKVIQPCFNSNFKDKYVARYGKIHRKKTPSKFGYKCITNVPGYKFCKFCNAILPLEAFYVTTQRYVCRRHHYLRVRKRMKYLSSNFPEIKFAKTSWELLDSVKFYLGYDKLRYDLSDIQSIFKNLSTIMPIYELEPVCVPIDFSIPMRPANVAVISKQAFLILTRILKFISLKPFYISFVQHMNVVPKNFDVGMPDAPWHDKNYVRQDYDVVEVWKMYKENNFPLEHQDNDIIQEFQMENKAPWQICNILPPGDAGKWIDGKPLASNSQLPESI